MNNNAFKITPRYEKYIVVAYDASSVIDCLENFCRITGYSVDREAPNLKEAKRLANYLMSEDFRRVGEMSARFEYAAVYDKAGDCVADYYLPTPETTAKCESLRAALEN